MPLFDRQTLIAVAPCASPINSRASLATGISSGERFWVISFNSAAFAPRSRCRYTMRDQALRQAPAPRRRCSLERYIGHLMATLRAEPANEAQKLRVKTARTKRPIMRRPSFCLIAARMPVMISFAERNAVESIARVTHVTRSASHFQLK